MSPAISRENQRRGRSSSRSYFRSFEDVGRAQAAIGEPIDLPKAFWLQGVLLSAKDSVQQNWGRIQAETQEQYSLTLERPRRRTRAAPRTGKVVQLFVAPQRGRGARSKPRARDAVQAIKDELVEIMAATGDVPLRQLAQELREAVELHEKVALVRSWVDHLEQRVRGPRKSPSEAVTKAVVLERLEGFVDQIDGPVAYVTLKSQYGDELTGEYAADELAAKGISEGRRFRCETVEVDGAVRVLLEALPDEPVTEDEEDAISRRMAELIQGDELDGDY